MNFYRFVAVLTIVFFSATSFAQRLITPFSYDNKIWGFVDNKGDEVLVPKYTHPTNVTKSGVAGVYVATEKRFKLINMKDEEIATQIPGVITHIKYIYDKGNKPGEYFLMAVNKKWGVIDANGKVLFNPGYDRISKFNDGCATATIGSIWFILCSDGKVNQLQNSFKSIGKFSEGYASFVGIDGRCGFINVKGEIVIQPKYKGVGDFSNGLAWVRGYDNKLGYINKKGDQVINSKYTFVSNFDPVSKRSIAKVEKQTLIIKEDGTEIITSVNTSIKKFIEGVAVAGEEGRWGYLDKEGKWLVPAKYEHVDDFNEGVGLVRLGKLWGIVDASGKTVVEPTYQAISEFNDGFAVVKKDGKWGIINKSGKVVCEPRFLGLKSFRP
ncbi:MAG: WG repeat-containing protein [Crocinitomicaceae bacterium]|nr:WG repeat-containing protein [Crocinitomicaceae bacterium]